MSFLVYQNGGGQTYTNFDSKLQLRRLNENIMTKPPYPFPGKGMYSNKSTPLFDNCYLEPMSALYSGMQKDCLKFYDNASSERVELRARQNGTDNLPDHFSRYGYNAATGSCRNGYCLNNHNGRYIVGERELQAGVFGDPPGMAPNSWYQKKEEDEKQMYWYPSDGSNAH